MKLVASAHRVLLIDDEGREVMFKNVNARWFIRTFINSERGFSMFNDRKKFVSWKIANLYAKEQQILAKINPIVSCYFVWS